MTSGIFTPAESNRSPIDLASLLRIFWHRRLIILVAMAFGLLLSIILLHTATYRYTIELRVTPASNSGSAAGGGNVSGLAAIAGIKMGNAQPAAPFELYLEALHSHEVAAMVARDPAIMRRLFSSEWDSSSRKWVQPRANGVLKAVKALLGVPNYAWEAPDAARLQDYLAATIKVTQNPESPIVVVSYEDPDPSFGVRLLSSADRAADALLRAKALDRTSSNIAYLAQKLNSVQLAEHRMVLAQTLAEQERARMMANSRGAFAADPFGPPTSSLRPTRPQPITTLAAGLVGGLFFGMFISVIKQYLITRRRVLGSSI